MIKMNDNEYSEDLNGDTLSNKEMHELGKILDAGMHWKTN